MTGTASQDNSFNQDLNGMDKTGWTYKGTWSALNVYSKTVTAAEGGFSSLYHTVVFDKNTGDTPPAPDTKTVSTGSALGTLPDTSTMTKKGGFVFQGWNTKADGSGITVTPDMVINSDITVYAIWSSSSIFQVTFDPNSGNWSGSTSNKTASTINGVVGGNMPVDPTRSGYEFQGWTLVRDSNQNTFDSSTPVSAPLTVYAYWVEIGTKSQPVRFYNNEGTSLMASIYPNGASSNYNAPTPLPTRTGYTFAGWSVTQSGSTVDKASGFTIGSKPTVFSYYAVWTKASTSYSLTFNANEGTLKDVASRTVTDGLFGTMPIPPERSGYEFMEWNRQADGTGETLYPTTPITQATTVYAIWKQAQQVTFYANDGSLANEAIGAVDYQLNYFPQTPLREGYTFLGWSTQSGEANTANANLMNLGGHLGLFSLAAVENILDFYAVWDPIYTVTFDGNSGDWGGSPLVTTQSVPTANGGVLYLPESPLLSNYYHVTWNTEPDGSGETFTLASAVTGNMTVYAQYEPQSISIPFDANGGAYLDASTQKSVEETYGSFFILPAETPTWEGYTFASWNTKADGTGETITASTAFTDLTLPAVYALWTPEGYVTINYLSDNVLHGTVSSGHETLDPLLGTALGSTAAPKTGYHFLKWVDAEGATVSTEAVFIPSKAGEPAEYAAATYTAIFEADTYTITYNLDEGANAPENPATYTYGDRIILHDPVKDGYRFDGWYDSSDNLVTEIPAGDTGNRTFTARWTKIHTVTYESDGGTAIEPADVLNGETIPSAPTPPVKQGYTFGGWYLDDGTFTDPFTFGSTAITGDITLYGKWIADTDTPYTVKHYKESPLTGAYVLNEEENLTGTTAATATASARNYMGYSENSSHPSQVATGTIAGDGTLVLSLYYSLNDYPVTFYGTQGTYSDSTTEKILEQNYGSLYRMPSAPPSSLTFTFVGWNTKEDGSGVAVTAESLFDDPTITAVYAQWINPHGDLLIDYVVINYSPEDNTMGDVSQSMDYLDPVEGVPAEIRAIPKKGYRLVKWVDKDKNTVGEEEAFTPEKDPVSGMYAAADYTAVFAPEVYTITYDLEGGSNHTDNPYLYEYGQTVQLESPVRDGYEFLGWYNKDGNRVTEITLGEMGDLELFAQWAKAASVTVLPQTGNGSQFAGLLAVILGGALALLSTRTRTKRR